MVHTQASSALLCLEMCLVRQDFLKAREAAVWMSASSPVKGHEVTSEIYFNLGRIPDRSPLVMKPGVKVLPLLKERNKGTFSEALQRLNLPISQSWRLGGKWNN